MNEFRSFWETDAAKIQPQEVEKMLYRNAAVEVFLANIDKYFIVASKGIGKTLLLKLKRYNLEKAHGEDNKKANPYIIPTSNPYIDFSNEFYYFDKKVKKFLEDFENAKFMWKTSIKLSIIQYFKRESRSDFSNAFDDFPKVFKEIINHRSHLTPSYIFEKLLYEMDISEIRSDMFRIRNELTRIYRDNINSAIYVFMDRLDQALVKCSKKMWISMQIGLMEAAWDLTRDNNHVKIYCSIRQEAYFNYISSNKLAKAAEVTLLNYSIDELIELIDKLANHYTNGKKEKFHEIIGFDKFTHPKSGLEEETIGYIIRHTMSRPRDLVYIASNFSTMSNLDVNSFREYVNKWSSEGIAKNLFEENKLFLDCLSDSEQRDYFLSLIPENILTFESIQNICREFNDQSKCSVEKCSSCNLNHPFCELYNLGLLGYVDKEDVKGNSLYKQQFKDPYDISYSNSGHLPFKANYYLVHPCLNNYIKTLRNKQKDKFLITQFITVGSNYPWTEFYTQAYEFSKIVKKIEDEELKANIREALSRLPHEEEPAKNVYEKIKNLLTNYNSITQLPINTTDILKKVNNLISLYIDN